MARATFGPRAATITATSLLVSWALVLPYYLGTEAENELGVLRSIEKGKHSFFSPFFLSVMPRLA